MITDDQLKEWRALCEKATPGEWRVINEIDPNPIFLETWGPDYKTMWFIQRGGENDRPSFSSLQNVTPRETMMLEQDVRFITASRTAVPALLDEVERLHRESLPGYCGQNAVFPKGRVGCGDTFVVPEQVFRCVDCLVPFHKKCLGSHCVNELSATRAERDALRSKLAKAKNVIKILATDLGSSPDAIPVRIVDIARAALAEM